MYDDVETLEPIPRPRWPLYPRPRPFERIDNYVRRLAECYETGVATFCRYGLGEDVGSLDAFADDPPLSVLKRLSTGTGVPIRALRNMTTARCHRRLAAALRKLVRNHPELVHKSLLEIYGQTGFRDGI